MKEPIATARFIKMLRHSGLCRGVVVECHPLRNAWVSHNGYTFPKDYAWDVCYERYGDKKFRYYFCAETITEG